MRSFYPISSELQEKLDRVPDNPGIYQYFDESGKIIYVGKAKNLKKRITTYFTNGHADSPKTLILVKKIRDIKIIVVETEEDALLLENNLIKEYRPRYNVLLKDDKTYPSICIKKENFPRVFQTRNIVQDGSEYFGPYSSVPMVRAMLGLIKQIYPVRNCRLLMLEKDIKEGKYKTCLEYQIKKCLGPCEGLQSKESYNENINQIREILNGNVRQISKHILRQMQDLAKDLRFEEAQLLKVKYDLIEQYRSKSAIVNSGLNNIEAFSYDETDQSAIINYLYLINGCIIRGLTFEYKKRLEENKEELLSLAIHEMHQRYISNCKEIIVPFLPEVKLENTNFIIPQRGDRKKILDLSLQNVHQYKADLLKQQEKLNPEQRSTRILNAAKKDLHLKDLPLHIECFDN